VNLSPDGRLDFRVPTVKIPVEFTNAAYERTEREAVLDTVVIEPEERRVTLAWRASHPLKRNIIEMRQVVIGRMPRGWYRARYLGKIYYPSINMIARNGGSV
jgi:hypothetical protein